MIDHFHVVSLFLPFNLTCPELWSEPGHEDEDAELVFFYQTLIMLFLNTTGYEIMPYFNHI